MPSVLNDQPVIQLGTFGKRSLKEVSPEEEKGKKQPKLDE